MEPSQFVSVVPKYPDKMGFDEVGEVSVCVRTRSRVCMCAACLHGYFGMQAWVRPRASTTGEKARGSWGKLLMFAAPHVS